MVYAYSEIMDHFERAKQRGARGGHIYVTIM